MGSGGGGGFGFGGGGTTRSDPELSARVERLGKGLRLSLIANGALAVCIVAFLGVIVWLGEYD